MSGIYIHIPFCKKACTYCDFHFSTSPKLVDRVTGGIVREIELRAHEGKSPLRTIYFGGGTPGILDELQLGKIVDALNKHFKIQPDVEFTFEANPDDFTKDKVAFWKSMGINRLSIGIQSFFDAHLAWMNRAHNALQAEKSITHALERGFTNLTIDLIYGIPEMTLKEWELNLQKSVEIGVGHISAYCLTVEPNTALGRRVFKGLEKPVDEDDSAMHYELLTEYLSTAGLIHYEVSNFSRPGFESRHNTSYWEGVPFIGIGPSAHGFTGEERYWNIANNARYCKAIEENRIPETREKLTREAKFNEHIMTGLRTAKGIDLNRVCDEFGISLEEDRANYLNQLIRSGLAKVEGNWLSLTRTGLFRADGIAAEFFILQHEDQT